MPASQVAEKRKFPVIPSAARNPSSIETEGKERFLTSQSPFEMTDGAFFPGGFGSHVKSRQYRALAPEGLPSLFASSRARVETRA
jgi:hypothetical protein